ncbi:hypothetical protein R1flu_026802 [Riccia fluitans]|uniref:Uncharacterized protein n=1 Tax=Riccia fluitans TaxID=41844 RepID=A0ABD1XGX6_9MARC
MKCAMSIRTGEWRRSGASPEKWRECQFENRDTSKHPPSDDPTPNNAKRTTKSRKENQGQQTAHAKDTN